MPTSAYDLPHLTVLEDNDSDNDSLHLGDRSVTTRQPPNEGFPVAPRQRCRLSCLEAFVRGKAALADLRGRGDHGGPGQHGRRRWTTSTPQKLRDAVTVNGILGHERVLQRIANQNGGTRLRHARLRRLGRRMSSPQLRQGRLPGQRAGVQVPVLPGARPGDASTQISPTPTTSSSRRPWTTPAAATSPARGPDQRHRHPADPGPEFDVRLRAARLRPGLGGGAAGRAGPARHLHLRGQGQQRQDGRLRRGRRSSTRASPAATDC